MTGIERSVGESVGIKVGEFVGAGFGIEASEYVGSEVGA